MLRTISLSTLVFLICLTAVAQKNKVKKDVIYLGKAPIATIMGEAGVDHTLFTVMAKGEEIIKVSDGHFNIDNPFFKNFSWYTVEFSDTGKKLRLNHGGNCNAKCVVKNILLSHDFYFDGGNIKDQDQIISKYDITNEIADDTTEIRTQHEDMLSLIKQNEILRDKQKPVKLMVEKEDFNSSAFTKTTVYNIAQDNVIIGSIVKRHFQNSNSQRVDYDVYEKLYEPVNGKSEVGICRVTSTFIDLEFKTVIDGKEHEIDIQDKYNAQNALAIYLIREGYL